MTLVAVGVTVDPGVAIETEAAAIYASSLMFCVKSGFLLTMHGGGGVMVTP